MPSVRIAVTGQWWVWEPRLPVICLREDGRTTEELLAGLLARSEPAAAATAIEPDRRPE